MKERTGGTRVPLEQLETVNGVWYLFTASNAGGFCLYEIMCKFYAFLVWVEPKFSSRMRNTFNSAVRTVSIGLSLHLKAVRSWGLLSTSCPFVLLSLLSALSDSLTSQSVQSSRYLILERKGMSEKWTEKWRYSNEMIQERISSAIDLRDSKYTSTRLRVWQPQQQHGNVCLGMHWPLYKPVTTCVCVWDTFNKFNLVTKIES